MSRANEQWPGEPAKPPRCQVCRTESLNLFQPDTDLPERVLGYCRKCLFVYEVSLAEGRPGSIPHWRVRKVRALAVTA